MNRENGIEGGVLNTIYDDGAGVRIDHALAMFYGASYSISNINSVAVEGKTPKDEKKGCGCALIPTGILLILAAIVSIVNSSDGQSVVVCGLLGAMIITFGVYFLCSPLPTTTWRLVFTMSNGFIETITSTDREVLERVKQAIEEAMHPTI